MSKPGPLIYHALASDESDDRFSDSDFEPELPPVKHLNPGNIFHSRTDSTSTTTSLESSGSTNSVLSSCSSSRNRYLYPEADTIEPLRPEELRWFYKDHGDKKWIPFIGYDSLRLECKYRETLQSRALSQCLEDGEEEEEEEEEQDLERVLVRGGLYETDVRSRTCNPIYWSQKEKPTLITRGTWFLHGSWQPIEESHAEQIESEHLQKFEKKKVVKEIPEPVKGPIPIIHNIKFPEFHIDWNSMTKVFLHYETASSKFYRAVGTKLGLNKSGTQLHRGYNQEAGMDDKPPDITHLLFVIHGIGQKMETGSIIKSCKDLRATCKKLKEKYFPGMDEANQRVEFLPVEWRSALKLDGDTVESITPNKLKGLRTMLNSSAMDIMYYTSPLYRSEITQGLKSQLNKLYEMFCSRHPYFEASGGRVSIVAHSLGCVITYDIITGWNPIQLYDQYVSSFIEEKCQQVENSSKLIAQLEEARKQVNDIEKEILNLAEKQHLKTPSLNFKLASFFCLGSPLAVFLALRGVRPQGMTTQDHILPTSLCQRLYNIYHPSDPVAYRLEPLILKHYSDIKPLRIYRTDTSKKDPYDSLPLIKIHSETGKTVKGSGEGADKGGGDPSGDPSGDPEILAEVVQGLEEAREVNGDGAGKKEEQGDRRSSGWGFVFRRNKKNDEMSREHTPQDSPRLERKRDHGSDSRLGVDSRLGGSKLKLSGSQAEGLDEGVDDEAELSHRLDFVLREGKMEHAYLAALTSHTSYWLNQDIAMFVMTQLFSDYGPR